MVGLSAFILDMVGFSNRATSTEKVGRQRDLLDVVMHERDCCDAELLGEKRKSEIRSDADFPANWDASLFCD
jgi:hypothetical protein